MVLNTYMGGICEGACDGNAIPFVTMSFKPGGTCGYGLGVQFLMWVDFRMFSRCTGLKV